MLDVSTINNDTNDEFARNIATNVKTLMRHRGIKAVDAYRRLHISNGTWYSHMNTGAWSARQMAELADMLDVSVEILYGNPEDLLRTGSFATPLTLVTGDATDEDRSPRRGRLSVVR